MDTPENSGGFIGEAVNTVNITNNLSLADLQTEGYKFDGRTEDKKLFSTDEHDIYANNYELTDTKGRATSQRNSSINNIIVQIDSDKITENFFKNELQFSTEVWDLSQVNSGGLPKLKNSDPNDDLKIIEDNDEEAIEDVPMEEENKSVEVQEPENNTQIQEQNTQESEVSQDTSITEENEVQEDLEVPSETQESPPEETVQDKVIVTVPDVIGVS